MTRSRFDNMNAIRYEWASLHSPTMCCVTYAYNIGTQFIVTLCNSSTRTMQIMSRTNITFSSVIVS